MNVLLDFVNEILDDAGREPVSSLTPEIRLREDLGFDSLELAVLTVKIESKFKVDVFADGIVRTIGEIEDKVSREK